MRLGRIATRSGLRFGIPVLLAALLAVVPTLLVGPPEPLVHDEHAYLLAADTFASGRLTNPTHEHWRHFETIHQLQRPSYQGKYPPAQGLALALGQVLWHPILGVWLSVAAMIASFVWMLGAFAPPRWAFLGGVLAALNLVVLGRAYGGAQMGYWSQSYWGGAVAATGGALVFGALPRILRRPRVATGLALGLGLVVLASSRPKEGLIVALPCAVVLAVGLARQRGAALRTTALRALVPVCVVLAVGGALTALYNLRVTGDPFLMPWLAHYQQYCAFRLYVWQTPHRHLEWSNPELAGWYGGTEVEFVTRHHSLSGFLDASARKVVRMASFFVGPALAPALCFLPRALRRPGTRLALVCCGLTAVNNLITTASFPHYSAPVAGLVLLVLVQGLRHARHWRWRGRAWGGALVRAVVVASCLCAVYGVYAATQDNVAQKGRRYELKRELEREGGRHLVLLRYGPEHDPSDEWVFNRADIDAARIVWARSLSPEEDAELLRYFEGRRVWVLEVGFERGVEHLRALEG